MELVYVSTKPISKKEAESGVKFMKQTLGLPPKCIFKGFKFRTCRCFRQNYFNLKGYHTRFMLQTEQTNRLHAKCKLYSKTKKISICENKEPHLSQKPDSTIIFNKDQTLFSLFQGSHLGRKLMGLKINKIKEHPREMEINFFNNAIDPQIPQNMKSAKPVLEFGIRWRVELHSNSVVLSVKNCCIEDSNHHPYFFIRKLSEDILEIESNQAISDMIVFALGIISFVGK